MVQVVALAKRSCLLDLSSVMRVPDVTKRDPDMKPTVVARSFSANDQHIFALLSGDWNPIHMDPVAARRTVAGAPVVHGIHAVLWALEALAERNLLHTLPASIAVRFVNFVHLQQTVSLRIVDSNPLSFQAELVIGELLTTKIGLKFGDRALESAVNEHAPDVVLAREQAPLQPTYEEMSRLAGWLKPPVEESEADGLFPHLKVLLGPDRVAGIVQLSTLVGMVCPGLHSLFSGFDLAFSDDVAPRRPGIGFRVTVANERYRIVKASVGRSGMAGDVSAIVRPKPQVVPSLAALRGLVRADEFSQQSALVIGGSRGLGAITAKRLAAGGARVTISYASGTDDAQALVHEINSARGEAVCTMLQADVALDLVASLDALDHPVSHLYHFATPKIFRQGSDVFNAESFAEFVVFYVQAVNVLCKWLVDQSDQSPVCLFYPSSIAVTDRPSGMTEYAMAKAAGEILCADLSSKHANLQILAPRLPRLATDQTASVAIVETEDAAAVLLPLLRSLDGRGLAASSGDQ